MDKIIIVGAGLGGLLLAFLLEKASLDYLILERMTTSTMPLEGGGVIPITSQIQPLLQQLGLLDALKQLAKPVSHISVYEANQEQKGKILCNKLGAIDKTVSFSRPELYNHLVGQLPKEKLLFGKQVENIVINSTRDSKATCVCTDGSSYQGIIIGADGAYSNVRLSLYRQLKECGRLPAQDHKPLQYQYRSLVGMTQPLDPDRFPVVKAEYSEIQVLVSKGSRPFSCWCVPMTRNRLCWLLDEELPGPIDCPEVEDWSDMKETIQMTCEKFRALQSPLENTLMGELFDLTPEGTMLSLPREEGFHFTWTHGKIALMGDGKLALVCGGQPFVQAGYDAVNLANLFYAYSRLVDQNASDTTASGALTATSSCPLEDLAVRLRSYESDRRSDALKAVQGSHVFGKIMSRQGWTGTMLRYIFLNYVPQFLVNSIIGDRLNSDRAQACFLPSVTMTNLD
ncbi:hypothetical protein BX616_011298 [Lobosporangium transversale]|nr:hypothetical protein BX616_011298 [Lobosporangium transversale]